jgi:hypothetical protein
MGQSIYRRLPSDARDALVRVAGQQFRSPDDQAALYVVEGLKRAGALPVDSPHRADSSAPVGGRT